MKIFHIAVSVSDGFNKASGDSVFCDSMSQAFEELGHEVVRYPPLQGSDGKTTPTFNWQYKIYSQLKKFVPKIATDYAKDAFILWSTRRYYNVYRSLLLDSPPDLIWERFCHFNDAAARFAMENGIPYITHMHANFEERRFYQRGNFEWLYIKKQLDIARMATLVVVVSGYLKNYLVDCGIDPEKIIVVHNGIDLDLFRENNQRQAMRQKYNIDDRLVIGFVGTMQWFHGLQYFPEVCQQVKREIPNAHFLLVGGFGSDEEKKKFTAAIREKGLDDSFTFTGRVPQTDVPTHVEAMDICYSPEVLHYGSPMKLFEYGAMGKAVLMPDYDPILEVLRQRENGMIFEKKNVADMVRKLIELAKDENARAAMGAQLQKEILTEHTWKKNADTILKAALKP